MNRRIPQYLSATVLIFLLFFLVLNVQPSGSNGIAVGLDSGLKPSIITFLILLVLLSVGFVGQLRAKKWGYTLTAVILVPVALTALVIGYVSLGLLSFLLGGALPQPLSMEEWVALGATLIFALLVPATIVTLIRYIRQKN
ncbi:MAG: hypothetical protein WBP22_04470 [Candidatus Saccharimonas sp.]